MLLCILWLGIAHKLNDVVRDSQTHDACHKMPSSQLNVLDALAASKRFAVLIVLLSNSPNNLLTTCHFILFASQEPSPHLIPKKS